MLKLYLQLIFFQKIELIFGVFDKLSIQNLSSSAAVVLLHCGLEKLFYYIVGHQQKNTPKKGCFFIYQIDFISVRKVGRHPHPFVCRLPGLAVAVPWQSRELTVRAAVEPQARVLLRAAENRRLLLVPEQRCLS